MDSDFIIMEIFIARNIMEKQKAGVLTLDDFIITKGFEILSKDVRLAIITKLIKRSNCTNQELARIVNLEL